MAPIRSTLFDISLKQSIHTISIRMDLNRKEITTENMMFLSELLRKELPTILNSTCFNEENIPFHKEVLSTELGHLFEHIMLEYLCLAKIALGFREATFSGITKWDWNKDPYGTFHINFSLEKEDLIFVSPALNKTIRLFESILLYSQPEMLSQQSFKHASLSV